jgi:hypothetical protein
MWIRPCRCLTTGPYVGLTTALAANSSQLPAKLVLSNYFQFKVLSKTTRVTNQILTPRNEPANDKKSLFVSLCMHGNFYV